MLRIAALAVFALSIPQASVVAQQVQGYERALIPVAVRNVPGEFGSIWSTSVWASNLALVRKDFLADEQCFATLCPPIALNPMESRPVAFKAQPSSNPGLVVFIEAPGKNVFLQTLVRDISQQSDSGGTELPAVREAAFREDLIRLVPIPMEPRFRQLLRIYALDAEQGSMVRVRFRDEFRRELGATDLSLQIPEGTGREFKPAYAQLSQFLALVPSLAAWRTVIVDVEPLTPGLRIWAFVSVTNNDAQHVTAITLD